MAEHGRHLEKTHFPHFPSSGCSDLADFVCVGSLKACQQHVITKLWYCTISREIVYGAISRNIMKWLYLSFKEDTISGQFGLFFLDRSEFPKDFFGNF